MQLMTNILILFLTAFSLGDYLESYFNFVGHVSNPVDSDSASKEVTLSHCFVSCIQNTNCYSFDFCTHSITENCYQYNKNRTSTNEADGGSCRRYKLKHLCEGEFTQPCRCPENRGGERCKFKYDCSGNLVTLATSSYVYSRTFTNSITRDLFCDMITDGGRWIVFQKRMDGSVDFYRNWNEYSDGFGSLDTEFYLGNQALHEIVREGNFELRIDLTDQNGEYRYAKYSHFSVGGPETLYTLSVTGYTGNASDSLGAHSGYKFSTYDMDNDPYEGYDCAGNFQGGWWYVLCGVSNLNGVYGQVGHQGIGWYHWKNAWDPFMSSTRMMIRLQIN